jgi:hypothetical protein
VPSAPPGDRPPRRQRLRLEIQEQPDDTTCGPTALHSVYRYHGDPIRIEQVIAEVPRLGNGGTLAVMLGCHARRRGYDATIYTYNLLMFDPTWFRPRVDLSERLTKQARAKQGTRLEAATQAYLEFLKLGGRIRFEELTPRLMQRILASGLPILTGLSATYLYRAPREVDATNEADDTAGQPVGHFVVLSGYDAAKGTVIVSDPYGSNPLSRTRHYHMSVPRVIGAIFLGALTYDANLLVLRPKQRTK